MPVPLPAAVDVERLRSGDVRHLARLISLVEDGGPAATGVLVDLAPHAGRAYVIGITGAPGVGKSTTTSRLIARYREQGRKVAVLAVDPSSPFSGGAVLGDRVRMQEHSGDAGVYIRSMASRGHLGGLAASTHQAIRVLDAAGFDLALIETVGVGQSEVEIAGTADTCVVLLAPGMGDGIQAAKAGILEIGDLFVVNKADREGADAAVRELRAMIDLGTWGDWRPPVVKAVAATGEGMDEVIAAIEAHRSWLDDSGERRVRRLRRVRAEITALVVGAARSRLDAKPNDLETWCARVLDGTADAYAAARALAGD